MENTSIDHSAIISFRTTKRDKKTSEEAKSSTKILGEGISEEEQSQSIADRPRRKAAIRAEKNLKDMQWNSFFGGGVLTNYIHLSILSYGMHVLT